MTYYILPKNTRTKQMVRPLFFSSSSPMHETYLKEVISKSVKMRRDALIQQIYAIVERKCMCASACTSDSGKKMNLHDFTGTTSKSCDFINGKSCDFINGKSCDFINGKSCDFINGVLETTIQMLNPVEYICTSTNTVNHISQTSKVKCTNPTLYNLFEIHNAFNMSEIFKHELTLRIHNYSSLSEQDIMQVFKKTNTCIKTLDLFDQSTPVAALSAPSTLSATLSLSATGVALEKGHILFFDTFTPPDPLVSGDANQEFSSQEEINKYFLSLICVLRLVLTSLRPNGTCIIKMFTMSYQLELDVMFILNCLFDKTYVLKPESSHPLISDRYFICKTFLNHIPEGLLEHTTSLEEKEGVYIHSLLQTPLPYIFLTKIEEVNAIIGQQQLDSHVHVINTIKTKLYEDKHTNIRKNNIYKAIQWCEKNGVPCNKTTEKYNAFSNPFFGFCKEKDKDKDNGRLSF